MAIRAYVALGSNLGHPRRRIARALAALSRLPRTRLLAASGNYVSAPIGAGEPQPDYVNAVASLATALGPAALLRQLQAIEHRFGRRRAPRERRNAPRVLDLDLLLFGRARIRRRGLAIPHPRMHQRAFVLRPLLEIAPSVALPGRGLARTWLGPTRGQRIAPTRRHIWRWAR
ncbi:MAG TPA: 2-amino-4-hydroxy-6-hydroxymethyldihydropteridine diphosphokinase [Casimicrobiaceae bacterium]|nr:2-amino-4-hydroxy-6-hydroxymethyldihydropteridine diphosphokinase [Casimicrobiaceae bacterium]